MPRHHHHGANPGLMLMVVGSLIGSPLIFWFGFFEYATTSMSIATGSGAFFSLATLGVGALIIYGGMGLAYLYYGLRECFHKDVNPMNLFRSSINNEDTLSFKGVIQIAGIVLFSPFIFIGGGIGTAAKAIVNKLPDSPSTTTEEQKSSYESAMLSSSSKDPEAPIHSNPLFPKIAPLKPEEEISISSDFRPG